MIGNFPGVLNFNRLFLKLNRSIYRFSSIIGAPQMLGSLPLGNKFNEGLDLIGKGTYILTRLISVTCSSLHYFYL